METIPAAIATTSMTLIEEGMSVADAVFFAALEETNECHDKAWAKAYGLTHWAELSENARGAWDWVFGREARLPRWATQDLSELNRIEDRILAQQERRWR